MIRGWLLILNWDSYLPWSLFINFRTHKRKSYTISLKFNLRTVDLKAKHRSKSKYWNFYTHNKQWGRQQVNSTFAHCPKPVVGAWTLHGRHYPSQVVGATAFRRDKKKNSLFWSDVRPQLNRANTAGVCISQLVNTSHKMALWNNDCQEKYLLANRTKIWIYILKCPLQNLKHSHPNDF